MQSHLRLSAPEDDPARPLRSSADWFRLFEENKTALLDIPWDIGPELTVSERRALGASIREFQRGESSEGHHLYRYAQRYAARSADREYVSAIGLFIAEEQRHARDLARFLTIHDIPLAKSTFSDRVFRNLRCLAGTLEISIAVLITAEIIAQVYYAALQKATGSKILGRLCEQILRDEAVHVQFQAEQLGKLRARHGPLRYGTAMALQRLLFFSTCLVVWFVHGRALRCGGSNFAAFWQNAWLQFDEAFRISGAARSRCRAAVPVQPPAGAAALN